MCTCYSTFRCTIVNRSCRIRRVCIFCEHERGSEERGSTKCYTQKHKCQSHQSISKPVAHCCGRRPGSSDATLLQSRPRTSEVTCATACTRRPSSALLHNALRSEEGRGILCAKEGIGKTCDMVWYVRLSCRLACRPAAPLPKVARRCHASPFTLAKFWGGLPASLGPFAACRIKSANSTSVLWYLLGLFMPGTTAFKQTRVYQIYE
jgi:hypothetical protein